MSFFLTQRYNKPISIFKPEHKQFLEKTPLFENGARYNQQDIKNKMESKYPEFKNITLRWFSQLLKNNDVKL